MRAGSWKGGSCHCGSTQGGGSAKPSSRQPGSYEDQIPRHLQAAGGSCRGIRASGRTGRKQWMGWGPRVPRQWEGPRH